MTDKDIEFYFSLKKRINQMPSIIVMLMCIFVLNGIWGFLPFLDTGTSYGISGVLIINLLQAWFKNGTDAQSHDLIESLINKDAELIKRVSEYKNL
ncbi:hypothetical protein [Pseudoalteromonas sp. S3431]|uniref:hypothetical protein n=1 Tax=Pseudoalteromonas sp. S3431 TaxID=579537 RepID=UPI0012F9A8E7|nr:hypothetical protein [Pseudoalteromonas sp. S3431]